ncbi:hypothetical protein GobsT_31470 [Gemmata obscuriglobus]|nr:hypothetical protein GobsT_31470 [Gemmata obscuriglobus]VTS06277.1 unnamed protein product [Gemmata obscuriglobus UQM 2246]
MSATSALKRRKPLEKPTTGWLRPFFGPLAWCFSHEYMVIVTHTKCDNRL